MSEEREYVARLTNAQITAVCDAISHRRRAHNRSIRTAEQNRAAGIPIQWGTYG